MYLRGVDWIHHGLDRDQWLALVNTVLWNRRISRVAEQLLVSQISVE
jgi:hypothetical protein